MSYDTIKARNARAERAAARRLHPQIGDYVYVHNTASVLHGLRAKVLAVRFLLCADLDFERDIKVPGQAPQVQRVWRIPLDELKFTPPEDL